MNTFIEYEKHDALSLAALVRKGEVSPLELLESAKQKLAGINSKLNAVNYESDTLARKLIKNLNKNSPFCGVPFLVKDLMLPIKGTPMSNGSRAMKAVISKESCKLIDKLNEAGFIIFGKTTTSELGASSLVNTAAFGATLNPWDMTKNAGGSSGGSSVVVATRVVPMAYSSDGGGSIRLPASYCGIFGFKPTKGLNRYEDMTRAWGGAVVSHASSISVRDSAAYLDVVSGNTRNNGCFSNPAENTYHFSAIHYEKKLKIGLITEAPTKTDVHEQCVKAANVAAGYCESFGHDVEPAKWNFDVTGGYDKRPGGTVGTASGYTSPYNVAFDEKYNLYDQSYFGWAVDKWTFTGTIPTVPITIVTAVKKEDNSIPVSFKLSQNYPNPFNPSTTIDFSLRKASNIILSVYDINGKLVTKLINGAHFSTGNYSITFDASKLASGIYIYVLKTNTQQLSKKMTLVK